MDVLSSVFQDIKKSLKESLETEDTIKIAPYAPHVKESSVPPSPVIYSDELRYLNMHWGDWASPGDFSSHRAVLGRWIILFKRKLQKFIFEGLCKDYYEREKAFMSNLVRFCNATARYVDERDKNVFWDLIRKLDNEIQHSDLRNDTLFVSMLDECNSTIQSLKDTIKEQDRRIRELESCLLIKNSGN